MENKLKKMFEYQRFAQNKRLDDMLTEAENDLENVLSDEELAFVAGGAFSVELEDNKSVFNKRS